jgi:hypothetical protein
VKRRKWSLIALSLALLVACVGVWTWSGRPSFGFLERVQAGPLSIGLDGTCSETYFSPSAASEMEKAAKRELLASGWQPSAEGRSWQSPDQSATLIFLRTGRYHFYYAADPAPAKGVLPWL